MDLTEIVTATNDILALRQPTASDLLRVCNVACRALGLLAEDDEFFGQVRAALARSQTRPAEVARVFQDLGHFQAFLREETPALIRAGVEHSAADALLRQAQELRQQSRAERVDLDSLRSGIIGLRDQVCDLTDVLRHSADQAELRGRVRRLLGRAAKVIGGAAVVTVNGASATLLGPVFTDASILLGVELVIDALSTDWEVDSGQA